MSFLSSFPQRFAVVGTLFLCLGAASKANAGTFTVTSTGDTDGSTCSTSAPCTLRQAINSANANSEGDNFITFASGLSGTITLLSSLPAISNSIVINGPTDAKLTVSGNALYQILAVNEDASLYLSRLTFANGKSGTKPGGAFSNLGTLNISGCTFSDNNSSNTGGAIYNGGTLTISNSTFSGNSAPYGGAIDEAGLLTIEGSTFAGNSAQYGGALRLAGARTELSNTLLAGNIAEYGPNILGVVGTGDYNLLDDANDASFPGDHNITGKAAMLGELADNGGPTKTFALLAGSPAIDKGSTYLFRDQRGIIRPQGTATDIGAFEYVASDNAPVIDSVTIMPSSPKTKDVLTANVTPSGTFSYLYQWYKNDAKLTGETQKTLNLATAGNGNKGDKITVSVVAKDGDLTSDSVTSDAVEIVNSAPVVAGIIINQGSPKTNDHLTFSIGTLTDADGDTVKPTYQWKKNGTNISGQKGAELDLSQAGNGNKGDKISVVVTASDGSISTSFESPQVTIGNSLPVVTSVTITPATALIDSTLTAVVNATDADEADTAGLIYNYVWKKNNRAIPEVVGPKLDLSQAGNGDDGDQITVTVTVSDGSDESEAVTSAATTIGNDLPKVVSLSPQGLVDRVGLKRIFTLTMSDGNGARDIREMWLLINTTLDWSAGATLIYCPSATSPTNGLLYLRRGDEFLPPIAVGNGASPNAVLDNGAIRIIGSEVTVSVSNDGNSIVLNLPLTFRDGLVGQNRMFARVQDGTGAVDPASLAGDFGFIRFGTYTILPQFSGDLNNAPTLSKLTPGATTTRITSAGIAPAVQTFGFFAKDEDGIGDIQEMWFLANKTRGWANSATFVYYPRTRRLVLRSDDGSNFLGGGVIGTPGILENSQVKLDLSKVKLTIYSDGKSLGLTLPVQAKSGLLGQNKVWLRVQDNRRATSPGSDDLGFVQSGTWNVSQGQGTTPNAEPSSGNS